MCVFLVNTPDNYRAQVSKYWPRFNVSGQLTPNVGRSNPRPPHIKCVIIPKTIFKADILPMWLSEILMSVHLQGKVEREIF